MNTLLQYNEPPVQETKKCPFCAETIQNEAIKCRYCGEFLDKPTRPRTKWYHSTGIIVLAILSLGPLALPLVWLHPRYSHAVKIGISLAVIALTFVLFWALAAAYSVLLEQINTLGLS